MVEVCNHIPIHYHANAEFSEYFVEVKDFEDKLSCKAKCIEINKPKNTSIQTKLSIVNEAPFNNSIWRKWKKTQKCGCQD